MPDILDNLTRAGRPVPAPNAISDMPVIDVAGSQPAPDPQPAPPIQPEAAPDAPDPTPELAPEPESKPKQTINERLSDYARARREAEARERKAYENLTAAMEQNKQLIERIDRMLAPAQVPAAPAVETRPTRDQFDSPDEYDAAMYRYAAREGARLATEEWEKKQAEQRQADEAKRIQQAEWQTKQQQILDWQTRRAAAVEKYPDFAEVAEADGVSVTSDMASAMMAIDEGPEVAYHLGKNPSEAAAIAKLSPVQQVAAIGRLAARLNAPPPPVTPPPTPPPINPLRTGNGATELSPDEDPNYMEKRLQQLRSQRVPGNIGMARN